MSLIRPLERNSTLLGERLDPAFVDCFKRFDGVVHVFVHRTLLLGRKIQHLPDARAGDELPSAERTALPSAKGLM